MFIVVIVLPDNLSAGLFYNLTPLKSEKYTIEKEIPTVNYSVNKSLFVSYC